MTQALYAHMNNKRKRKKKKKKRRPFPADIVMPFMTLQADKTRQQAWNSRVQTGFQLHSSLPYMCLDGQSLHTHKQQHSL
jgi:hypothetical protein